MNAMKKFKLTKTEKLMMVNTPPRTELEIQLVNIYIYFQSFAKQVLH